MGRIQERIQKRIQKRCGEERSETGKKAETILGERVGTDSVKMGEKDGTASRDREKEVKDLEELGRKIGQKQEKYGEGEV